VTDPDLNHPRTDEFNISYEQMLGTQVKLTGTYIKRRAKNFLNSTLINGQWAASPFTNPMTGQAMTIYQWANRSSIEQQFLISNVDDVNYVGAGSVESYRDYNGVMLVLNKTYSNRWQGQVSYVYSKTEGNVTSASQAGFASSQFETPNTILINRDGRVPLDRPHELKVFAGYQIPKVEVSLNGYWRTVSGQTYTPFSRQTAGRVNWTSSVDVNLQPFGFDRVETLNMLDLRLEKVFNYRVNRFGIYADIENVFNANPALTRNDRFPSTTISGNTVAYGNVTAVAAARQTTFGVRWSF
jgi:hypothetical protein